MAMMAGGVYQALLAAGSPEDKVRLAAEEIAVVNRHHVDLRGAFDKVRGEFSLVKWMMGTMIALQLGTIGTIVGVAINHATFH